MQWCLHKKTQAEIWSLCTWVFHLGFYQWKYNIMGSTSALFYGVLASTLGLSKHHYHSNDPLSHLVEKGQHGCPSNLSQTCVQPFHFAKANSCMRVLLFLYLQVLLYIHKCVRLHLCAQGKGNEDRWGSFKQPGFTSREVSSSSNSPWRRGEGKAPVLPSFIISSPRCIRTQPHVSVKT